MPLKQADNRPSGATGPQGLGGPNVQNAGGRPSLPGPQQPQGRSFYGTDFRYIFLIILPSFVGITNQANGPSSASSLPTIMSPPSQHNQQQQNLIQTSGPQQPNNLPTSTSSPSPGKKRVFIKLFFFN